MDRHDFHLGFGIAYALAIGLHLAMAWLIRTRTSGSSETRLFAAANLALAAWQASQAIELLVYGQVFSLGQAAQRALAAVQLLLIGLVLALFFHLLCTFERVYRRRAPSLRAAITTELHRHERFWVPGAYLTVVLAAALYLGEAAGDGWPLSTIRATIGPTSAYLFGGALFFMTFVLFPARAGQEKIVVPTMARAVLLMSLAMSLLAIALWHGSHPSRTQLVLLPWLHLHSVGFVVFLALVRYEFRFMDSYIRESARLFGWVSVVGLAYLLFNRVGALFGPLGPYFLSLSRILVLLAGVALSPWVGRQLARLVDRLLLAREVELEGYVHTLAGRMAHTNSLETLVQAAAGDIAHAVHAKKVHIVVGGSAKARETVRERESGDEAFRLRVPMGDPKEPNGWILLGERRNLYPYFNGERRFLAAVGELLGGAIHAIRSRPAARDERVETASGVGEADAELERLRHALSFTRRELRGERERFDPEMVGDVLGIADELGSGNAEAALGVVRSLERVLRHALSEPLGRSSLAAEMAFARDYLALEKLRLRNRLEVDLRYEPGLQHQIVPHRLLQPLIENALSHGLRRELRVGKIRIHASLGDDAVELQVEDNGAGLPSSLASDPTEGEGGIGRVTHWLRRMFGEASEVRIEPGAEVGTIVTLRFPLRLKDERAERNAEA
ncbi:MAG TPA: ATP-binding protein [Candidatus Krumholzibacteria bacterium]